MFIPVYVIMKTDSSHIPEANSFHMRLKRETLSMRIAVNSWTPLEIKIKSLNYTQKLQWSKQKTQAAFWKVNLFLGKEIIYDIGI